MKFYFEREYQELTLEWFCVEADSLNEAADKVRDYRVDPKEHETIDSECIGFHQIKEGSRQRIREIEI